MIITQARIREIYDYNPETGVFTFLPRKPESFATPRAAGIFKSKCLGKPAGWRHTLGYVVINADGKPRLAHRMAWIWMKGEVPFAEIDHINGDRADNRFANLRAVPKVDNCRNRSLHKDNTSGVNGVFWEARRGVWRAEIKSENRSIYLGQFKTMEEGKAARKAAERVLGYHARHGKIPVADYQYTPKKPRKLSLDPATSSPSKD